MKQGARGEGGVLLTHSPELAMAEAGFVPVDLDRSPGETLWNVCSWINGLARY